MSPPPGCRSVPIADRPFPYEWASNPAAWVGIGICIFLLILWLERNTITLRKGGRDSPGSD